MAALREPLVVHEATPIFRVLEQFKKAPVRLAMIFDEYGALEGIVTQTDLLEAIAGDLPSVGEEPDVVERADGSLLINGMMPAEDAFNRLGLRTRPEEGDFHTVAGFVLGQLGHLPEVGEHFDYEGWRFEVVDLDGRRIDKVLATPPKAKPDNVSMIGKDATPPVRQAERSRDRRVLVAAKRVASPSDSRGFS